MKKTAVKSFVYVFLLSVLFGACKKVEDPQKNSSIISSSTFAQGVFITNEGPFGSGTGTVSFYDRKLNTVRADIFQEVNNRPLGNVVQSMEIIGDKAYIVVNNANKIEVVNASTFKSVGSIANLEYPRYILSDGKGKAYISQWSSPGRIAVVQLDNLKILKTIVVADGPERMLLFGDKLYVVNTGGFGSENKVSVINTLTDELEQNITTGDSPNSLVLDANHKIWILCGGKKVYAGAPSYELDTAASTAGSLLMLDAISGQIEKSLSFSSKVLFPSNLCLNKEKNQLFFNGGDGVYAMKISDAVLPQQSIVNKVFYSLAYDTVSTYLYGSDPLDYQGKGEVYRYNSYGMEIDHFQAGIIPGNFTFR